MSAAEDVIRGTGWFESEGQAHAKKVAASIAGLLLRCGLALESEGIGPDERGIDSPNVDKLLWAWAAQLRPDIDELEPR